MSHRERPRCAASWSRRGFVGALAGVALLGGRSQAHASVDPRTSTASGRVVAVPHLTFATVVAAIADTDVTLVVDPGLAIDAMRMDDLTVSVADRLLHKGEGEARARYLDDARNAPKLGAAVRDHLRTHWPELGDAVARRHKAWSRLLVRNILRWTQALDHTGLRGKRVRDAEGWIYLLEWAGAEVAPDGIEPPAGLQHAPREPATTSPAAYDDYVQALVAALR